MAPMKLTSSRTIAYFDFVLDFSQYANIAANPAVASLLSSRGVQDLRLFQLFPEAFGPECAVNISWPGEKMKPEAFLAVQIKDQAKAEEALMSVLALFPETNSDRRRPSTGFTTSAPCKPPWPTPRSPSPRAMCWWASTQAI